MTDKKRSSKPSSKTNKLKNFLVTGSIEEEEGRIEMVEDEGTEETTEIPIPIEEGPLETEEEEVIIEDIVPATRSNEPDTIVPYPKMNTGADTGALEKEIAELKVIIAGLASQLDKYATSKEQMKENLAVMNRRDAEVANNKYMRMLEQLSMMREAFFKLCNGMNAKLGSFSAKDILSSFEAYGVDMENILADCGVQIGPSKYEKLNTINQRIVGVIPTDDESKNGMIAERVSERYEYQGRILLKEKVKIYKFSENKKTEGDEEK
jgi:molecular chaperone GrpE (heat shock protein)